ncbi:MAG: hypothetical protein HOE90_11065 [Bacteriovoracaceae bacterium]|jgi:hypothetical protein|nr:hypothetical protein [Bacteriovoracaceae bacterium]
MSKDINTKWAGNVHKYIENSELDQSLKLASEGALSFHWSDGKKSCDHMKGLFSGSDIRLERLEALIEELHAHAVWVKTPEKFYRVSMHEIFTAYLFNESSVIDLSDPEVEISTHCEKGPYFCVSLEGLPDVGKYRYFVYYQLLTEKLGARQFRLRLESPLLCFMQGDYTKAQFIFMKQITSHGILFHVPNNRTFTQLISKDYLHAYINTNFFKSALENNGESKCDNLYTNNPEDIFRIDWRMGITSETTKRWILGHMMGAGNRYIFVPFEFITRESEGDSIEESATEFLNEMGQKLDQVAS